VVIVSEMSSLIGTNMDWALLEPLDAISDTEANAEDMNLGLGEGSGDDGELLLFAFSALSVFCRSTPAPDGLVEYL
jgi:hypothetical protein